jgi:hypothetical protein
MNCGCCSLRVYGTPLIDLPDDSSAVMEIERICELLGI